MKGFTNSNLGQRLYNIVMDKIKNDALNEFHWIINSNTIMIIKNSMLIFSTNYDLQSLSTYVIQESKVQKPGRCLFERHPSVPDRLTVLQNLVLSFLARTTTSAKLVALQKTCIPEFNCNMVIDEQPVLIVDYTSLWYDIIFGSNLFDKCRFQLDNDNNPVQWMEHHIPPLIFFIQLLCFSIHPNWYWSWRQLSWQYLFWLFATGILDIKYEQVNINSVAFNQNHLLLDQCQDLFNELSKHKKLFDGSLEVYPHKRVHISHWPQTWS